MMIERKNKKLTVFSLVMINVIAIDSLRNLPSNAATGLQIIFYYILAGVIFLLPCVYLTTKLAQDRSQSGGAYAWVRDAFGPQWGFVTIWLQWIYNVFWYPTILSFIAANIAYLINPALVHNRFFMLPMIITMFTLATLVNQRGMKISSLISSVSAIIGTLLPMAFMIVLGISWIMSNKPLAITPSVSHFVPLSLGNNNAAFLVVVFFSLMGLEMSSVHASDVDNPKRDYPRALWISSIIILLTMILASAAIAIVVPSNNLNIISGLDQAFSLFLNAFHLTWLMPIIVVAMIIGGFGGMAAWVVGPTKGLMVAAEDGCAPKAFAQSNAHGAPSMMLAVQWGIVIVLCCCFLFFDSFSTWYWVLSNLTAQLALLFYIMLFAAAMCLRSIKSVKTTIAGVIGIGACIFAIVIGLIPPQSMHIANVWLYETCIIGGTVLFAVLPIALYKLAQKPQRSATSEAIA